MPQNILSHTWPIAIFCLFHQSARTHKLSSDYSSWYKVPVDAIVNISLGTAAPEAICNPILRLLGHYATEYSAVEKWLRHVNNGKAYR